MNREFILQGLDCANCASKIENALKGIEGIRSVSVNFMNTTMLVEYEKTFEASLANTIERIVHKYEPEIDVIDKGAKELSKESHKKAEDNRKELVSLLTGAGIFIAGIIIQKVLDPSLYIQFAIFLISYVILGGTVVLRAARNITRGQIFDENFLMSIATIGAFVIGDFPEAVAVMLFYQIGEYFQDLAVRRSKKSITELMDIRPDYANLKNGNTIQRVSPETIAVGDLILVKPGEKIPLDGVIVEGETMLDTRALTGESVPRKAKVNEEVISGCVNQTGVIAIRVTKTFGESTVARIIDLVENASSKKAPTENFITTFSKYYTPIVVGLAALLAILPPLFLGGGWSEWVNRGLIFLVISCPCALVVSIPLGFFGGIGGASKNGVLIKGSNYLEALNNLDTVVFDKTGTLTEGVFEVTDMIPANGFTKEELLMWAAKAEVYSNHPIALSVGKAYGSELDKNAVSEYEEIAGHGIGVMIEEKQLYAGNDKLMRLKKIDFSVTDISGTKLYLSIDGIYAGVIIISDRVKKDSALAIAELKKRNVSKTVMLTGDNRTAAEHIGAELGLDEVYAELLPDQKVEKVEMLDRLKREKGKLVFVGDGINDAPVLARADIGIAMGGLGSDAAIEAADVVLMTDEPSKLIEAIDIAKYTKRIVWQNIVFALGVKGVFLLMGALGYTTMWEAVFADVGVSLLAILNSMRVMRK